MYRDIDFTKTTKGIPRKGEETAEDIKYWKAILKNAEYQSKRYERMSYWDRVYDMGMSTAMEEMYAIPAWWLKENDR